MKSNTKCRPTTEGDRAVTKEINVRKKNEIDEKNPICNAKLRSYYLR